ncbi:MAG: c-type cytochrome [Acidimicrobiia bacterium]|nr:c-type cytochrome [Acidimicrobiia bacterium]
MRLQRTRRAIHKRWWIPALATLALVLNACSTESGPKNHQNSLRPEGKYAKQIDNLFTPVLWVAVIVGVGVIGATIFMAIRFRRRPGVDVRPKQTHGSTPLEIGWTILPAVILLIVAVPTVSTIFDLDEKPKNPIEITVVGKQWWWQFDYPKTDSGKAVVTANEMHIPTGRDVLLTLEACDESLPNGQAQADGSTSPGCNVLHSFWVPALAGKRDVVPGRENQMKVHADEEGVFLGQCAEYCGLSHANMRFRVIAQSPSEYEAWLESQREGPAVDLAESDAEDLFAARFQCGNCHTVGDSGVSTYGPNLTHIASRATFASGYYELTRSKLIQWLMDAPSLVPMQSEDCRLGSPGTIEGAICVGMPSFTNNTPNGDTKKYPDMTRSEAETLADFLLSLK